MEEIFTAILVSVIASITVKCICKCTSAVVEYIHKRFDRS